MGNVVDLAAVRRQKQKGARPWTSDEDQALVALWSSDAALVKIFAVMQKAWGRSLAEVCNRAELLMGVDEQGEAYLVPIDRALMVLRGEAARRCGRPGAFVLRGRPASPAEVIAAANASLRRRRRAEIEFDQ